MATDLSLSTNAFEPFACHDDGAGESTPVDAGFWCECEQEDGVCVSPIQHAPTASSGAGTQFSQTGAIWSSDGRRPWVLDVSGACLKHADRVVDRDPLPGRAFSKCFEFVLTFRNELNQAGVVAWCHFDMLTATWCTPFTRSDTYVKQSRARGTVGRVYACSLRSRTSNVRTCACRLRRSWWWRPPWGRNRGRTSHPRGCGVRPQIDLASDWGQTPSGNGSSTERHRALAPIVS